MFVFFFKQKTAYEMRISDWSSDVCSSDLEFEQPERQLVDEFAHLPIGKRDRLAAAREITDQPHRIGAIFDEAKEVIEERGFATDPHGEFRFLDHIDRSEEHTSELQSLMRISYAVFCLKKKKKQTQDQIVVSKTKNA